MIMVAAEYRAESTAALYLSTGVNRIASYLFEATLPFPFGKDP